MGCGASTPVKPIASGDPPVRAQQTSSSGSDADAKENGQPARTAVSAEPAAALAAGEAGAPSTGAPAAAADDDDFPAAPQKPRGAAAGVRRGSDLVMPFTESAFGASAEVKLREDDGPPVLNDAPPMSLAMQAELYRRKITAQATEGALDIEGGLPDLASAGVSAAAAASAVLSQGVEMGSRLLEKGRTTSEGRA